MGAVGRAARIAVGHHNAAAGHVETIHDHKPSGRYDLAEGIKGYGFPSLEGEFSHLMPADKRVFRIAAHGFQRGSIDDFLQFLDLAFDLLGGELELVAFALFEGLFAQPKNPGLEPAQCERPGAPQFRD